MDVPASTWSYFIAGYSVILGSLLLYVLSLVIRWRHLLKRLKQARMEKK